MRKSVVPVVALFAALGLWQFATTAQAKVATKDVSITSSSPKAVAAFKTGRSLSDNIRTVEAAAELKKAIELDPSFALAHAYLGANTPGGEGLKELEQANTLAAKLPEAERTEIQAMLADRRGEEQNARVLWQKLGTLAPGDWHVQFALGGQYQNERKYDQASAALEKATALNPKAGVAYNSLGYVYLSQNKNDAAIAAFKKYSELESGEPNPFDSLGEAQMAAGQFENAEASFRKALQISPAFHISWEGIAQTKFLRNDWAGGMDAMAKARAAAPRPVDKLGVDFDAAWNQYTAGKLDDAMKTYDALEAEAQAQNDEGSYMFVPIERANLLLEAGKSEEALAQVTLANERAKKAGIPGGTVNAARRAALRTRVAAEARLGKVEDASKTLALLEAEAKAAPNNSGLQSQLQYARGEVALARGDAKAAAAAFALCNDQESYSHWRQAAAQEQAGDLAGAAATRKTLMNANRRSAVYVYVRSQMSVAQAAVKKD